MSRTKHTPGDWKVIKPGHGHPSKYKCVQIGSDKMYTTSELLPDDARLIAASPKLLAACKAFLDIDNPPAGKPGHVDFNTAVEMMRAGVAEAEPQ